MKIALACEFVRDLPWSHSRWAPAIAIALAERGHTISVYADGVETPADFDYERVTLSVRNPRWTIKKRKPLRYQRWAMRSMGLMDQADTTLSLTPLVPADLWLPLGPGCREQFRAIVGERSLIVRAFETLQHRWLPGAIIAEHRALRLGGRRGIDPHAVTPAPPRPAQNPADETEQPTPDWRSLLHIAADTPLLVCSITESVPERLSVVAQAVSKADRAPVLVLLGSEWCSMHKLLDGAGLARERVRCVGVASDPRPLLQCAAAALVVQPRGPGGTQRMLMEALESAPQVVAAADASGQAEGVHTVGDPSSVASWCAAINAATDPKAPRQPRTPRTLDDFIDDIERRLVNTERRLVSTERPKR
ncbi:MAG: hypothetical protein JJU33_08750 [Phycisphaerales bacterium]|nr:hypothetical protein [Phycisphaerales bacterium]